MATNRNIQLACIVSYSSEDSMNTNQCLDEYFLYLWVPHSLLWYSWILHESKELDNDSFAFGIKFNWMYALYCFLISYSCMHGSWGLVSRYLAYVLVKWLIKICSINCTILF